MSSFGRKDHVKPQLWLLWAGVFLAWALVQFCLTMYSDAPVHDGGLIDPDSYMRLVRVSNLMHGGHWFDDTIARANAPFGDVLHWTRPFDVLLLLLALPTSFALDSEQSLYFAGLVVSPLGQLATALLLIWALRPLIRPQVWFLPAVALFLQPGALAYSLAGRADHHSLLLLVFVTTAGFMLRALSDPQDNRRALCAGLATGFGIWLSVEILLTMGLCLLALGLPWLFGERERAAQSKWYALGVCVTLLVALFVERPIGNLLEASYDKVSSVQYLLAAGVLIFWRIVETIEDRGRRDLGFLRRSSFGVVGVSAIALLITGVYPLFLAGPMADVDPRIGPIWLDRVLEMRPLVPTDRSNLGRFVFYLGGSVLVALPFLKILLEERSSPRFYPYLFIALACLLLSLVSVNHMRFSGYAEAVFVIAFAVVLDRLLQWTGRIDSDLVRGLLRGSFIGLMLMGPILVGGTLMTKPTSASTASGEPMSGCNVRKVAAYLESDPRWSAAPQTVLAFMDIGPELLYRTHHRVIGTPYHRNADGILDGYRILATDDLAAAHAMAEQRGIDLVLLCQSPSERSFYASEDDAENLYARLDHGNPPYWLATIELPPALQSQARLYRVVR